VKTGAKGGTVRFHMISIEKSLQWGGGKPKSCDMGPKIEQ